MKKSAFLPAAALAAALLIACGSEQQQDAAKSEATPQHEAMQSKTADTEMVVDPFCGMEIKKADATNTYEWEGKTYYFCMEADYNTFVADPKKYVAAAKE